MRAEESKPNLSVSVNGGAYNAVDSAEAKEEIKKVVAKTVNPGGEVSGTRLKAFIERVERLTEEKTALAEDIRDVYAEAKGTGFEPKIMRKIVSIRKANLEKRREEAELVHLYMAAIGMTEGGLF